MDEKEIDYKKLYKSSVKKYAVFFILIIVLILSKHFLMQNLLSQQDESSRNINIAGRQRMLSQKITKDSLLILDSDIKGEIEYYAKDLENSLKEFSESHQQLRNKNNDPVIEHLFADNDEFYKNIVGSGNEIVSSVKQSSTDLDKQKIQGEMETIRENEIFFLMQMDEIVYQYDAKMNSALSFIKKINNFFMVLITIMFFLLVTKLLRPIQMTVKNAFIDVHENSENLIKMFSTMRNPLFLLRECGEIALVNSQGEKLIEDFSVKSKKLNIKDSIEWLDYDISCVIDKIKEEGRVEGIETRIRTAKGEEMFFTLSGVSGTYKGKYAIFITMTDYTSQKKAEEHIKNIAIRDELTGLHNRRYLDMVIGDEIERAERYEIPLSLFILDIDYFKKINDDWGHPVGDSVLQMLGEIISKYSRLSDYQLRIGGEEFLVIMPHTDLVGAHMAAEKMRLEIERNIHPIAGKFTASFGVAERRKGDTYHQLYQNADTALYQAKKSGRNRVVSFENNTEEVITMEWKESWNCGEKNIDRQHKELFMLSNILLEDHALSSEKEEVLKHLDNIIYHLKEHFKYEESVLTKLKFTDLFNHKKIHNSLVDKAINVRKNINDEVIDSSEAFLLLFDEVVVGHMLKEDVKFFPLINKGS